MIAISGGPLPQSRLRARWHGEEEGRAEEGRSHQAAEAQNTFLSPTTVAEEQDGWQEEGQGGCKSTGMGAHRR